MTRKGNFGVGAPAIVATFAAMRVAGAVAFVAGSALGVGSIAEITRILKPGGRAVIVDINTTRAYAAELVSRGVAASVRGLGPRFWFGGP